MSDALIAYDEITAHAESICNDAEHDLRGKMEVGDCWAQGDLLIRKIEKVPNIACASEFSAQLAPGNTQGSRHCLRSPDGVQMYTISGATPLDGPVVSLECDNAVDHPEHGNVLLGPGVYAIEYQRAFGDELRRVQD